MKRCPTCQTLYTDDSLSYCLQDGSKLAVVSDSAASVEATWQISSADTRGRGEAPPTEILRPEDMPTARIEGAPSTREQQRARATAVSGTEHRQANESASQVTVAAPPPRGNATVIALSVIVGMLLITVAGLIWMMTRDKVQTEQQTRVATQNTNQSQTRTTNTTQTPAANSGATPAANTTPQASPADLVTARKEVQAALSAWAETVRGRNLEEHMRYYAETLDFYYNATNVSRERVRVDRSAAFTNYTSLDMQVANVKIEVAASGTRATVTFDKTFDFRNEEKRYNGSGLNLFLFIKDGGRWRIAGEKELKLYYLNR